MPRSMTTPPPDIAGAYCHAPGLTFVRRLSQPARARKTSPSCPSCMKRRNRMESSR